MKMATSRYSESSLRIFNYVLCRSQAKPSCLPCNLKFDTGKQLEKHKQTAHGPETVEGEAVEVTISGIHFS